MGVPRRETKDQQDGCRYPARLSQLKTNLASKHQAMVRAKVEAQRMLTNYLMVPSVGRA
jgi:hypothetical protein